MTSDHEMSLDLAISILVCFNPCIDHVIHLAGRALGVCEESSHELDGCAMEYSFTEYTVIVEARINGSAEEAFAWIHEDRAAHGKIQRMSPQFFLRSIKFMPATILQESQDTIHTGTGSISLTSFLFLDALANPYW
jgi:hypothetical protein